MPRQGRPRPAGMTPEGGWHRACTYQDEADATAPGAFRGGPSMTPQNASDKGPEVPPTSAVGTCIAVWEGMNRYGIDFSK